MSAARKGTPQGNVSTFRHATRARAALLLAAAWYLMLPPADDVKRKPFIGWTQHAAYETAAGCEIGKEQQAKEVASLIKRVPTDSPGWKMVDRMAVQIIYSQCVSVQDPRLR